MISQVMGKLDFFRKYSSRLSSSNQVEPQPSHGTIPESVMKGNNNEGYSTNVYSGLNDSVPRYMTHTTDYGEDTHANQRDRESDPSINIVRTGNVSNPPVDTNEGSQMRSTCSRLPYDNDDEYSLGSSVHHLGPHLQDDRTSIEGSHVHVMDMCAPVL